MPKGEFEMISFWALEPDSDDGDTNDFPPQTCWLLMFIICLSNLHIIEPYNC